MSDQIYICRGTRAWGKGKDAVEALWNCFRRESFMMDKSYFQISLLPAGAKDVQVSSLNGDISWNSEECHRDAEIEIIPFDKELRQEVADMLTDKLEDIRIAFKLIQMLEGNTNRVIKDVEAVEANLDQIYDWAAVEYKHGVV